MDDEKKTMTEITASITLEFTGSKPITKESASSDVSPLLLEVREVNENNNQSTSSSTIAVDWDRTEPPQRLASIAANKWHKRSMTVDTPSSRRTSIFDVLMRRTANGTHSTKKISLGVLESGGGGRPAVLRVKMKNGASSLDEADETAKANLICTFTESPYYIYKACAQGLADVVYVLLAENPKRVREPDPKGLTCLHHAANRGRVEIIKILLEKDADINAKDEEGNTPLHAAVEKNQVEAARFLLSFGADGNILNERGLSPIHCAAISNKVKVMEILVAYPQLVDVNIRGEHGKRAIHWAAKFDFEECVEILLKSGSRLCEPDDYGFYPIHVAAIKSSIRSLEAMLKFGEMRGYTRECMLSYADKEANSPLHLAVNSGNIDVVKICLEQGAKIDVRQESQATPFHFACSQGTLFIVKLMLENHLKRCGIEEGKEILLARDNAEMTPLHRAAMFDHVEVVKYLIEQGADIDAIDRQKCSPLLLAAARGAIHSIEVLLAAGASVILKDANKRHVLHFSVIYNSPRERQTLSIVEYICQTEIGKSLLNVKDSFGCTPLHVASKEGNLKFAEALIKLGANVNLKDNEDQSPLHFAARYGRYNTVRRLLESPAGPNILNETDARGMTALHVASMNGHTKVAQLLLEKGSLIHRNYQGRTPLHLAVANGYTQTIKMLLAFHSTLLDQRCKKGNTALHYACEENQAPAAELLLTAGCVYAKNDEEITPMDIAIQRRNAEVATVMVQHDRWKEVFSCCSKLYGCPLMGMIQHLPDVHKSVLDRCHIKSDADPNSRDYWLKYDFEYMQLPLAKVREIKKNGHPNFENGAKPLHTLNMMVRYGRVELLSHPVCLNFLQMKWRAYGVWFFFIHILFYSTFVGCLTATIIKAHERIPSPWANRSAMMAGGIAAGNSTSGMVPESNTGQPLSDESTVVCKLALTYLFGFCIANVFKEIMQMYQQRLRYVFDYVNYIEWTLYVTCICFAAPALFYERCFDEKCDDMQWQSGSVAVFLSWFMLLLYLQRLDTVGLYVVMFLQILNTVLKVIIVFSVLFIAFGLAFYILLSTSPNGSYGTPCIAILQAVMQLLGEYNYVDVYITPYFQLNGAQPLPYPALNFIFLVVFVVLMPILFVNLLIGLAVGDIEMVQRDAQLKRLAMQVEYHTELEEKLPLWILEKVDQNELVVYPHRCLKKNGLLSKLADRLHTMAGSVEFASSAAETHRRQNVAAEWSNDAIMEELENVRRRMKEIQSKTDNMHDLLRLIVQKMEIHSEADAFDEGRRQSDEDEERTHVGRKRALRLRAKMAPLILGKGLKD